MRRFVNNLCASINPSPNPTPKHASPNHTGQLGERIAERHLRDLGYRLLLRDFRPAHGGQVDLVMKAPNQRLLVFVEVKTRHATLPADEHLRPSDNLSPIQKERLRHAAHCWTSQLPDPETPARIDVIEIILHPNAPPEIHHLQDALLLDPPH